MSTILYKRLFEVRILHGYYLDGHIWNKNNPAFFQEYSLEKQNELLNQRYDIQRDLEIVPTKATEALLKRLQMRWQCTASGFFAGIEVTSRDNGKFAPKRIVPDGTTWTFLLRVRNPSFYNITNHVLRSTLPGHYLFTNRNDDSFAKRDHKDFEKKNPVSLSVPPAAFDASRSWEMGELALVGNNLNIASNGRDQFNALLDYQWANSSDRVALPKAFKYRFDPKWNNIKKATFKLSKLDNTEITKISFDFQNGTPDEVFLNFSYYPKQAGEDRPLPLPDGFYYLQVASQARTLENRWINLRSDIPEGDSVFGLVEIIYQKDQDDSFRLFDAAPGAPQLLRLKTSLSNPNLFVPDPFEVRLLRRETYWRYFVNNIITPPLPPKDNADPSAYLNPELEYKNGAGSKNIVTKNPKPLIRARTQLSADNSQSVFLPNPDSPTLNFDQNSKQYFTDFFLQSIKLS